MSETVNEAREALSGSELQELWSSLTPGARLEAFKALSRAEAEDCFWNLSAPDQVVLLLELPAVIFFTPLSILFVSEVKSCITRKR